MKMKICMLSFHSCPYSLLGGNGSGGMSIYLRELSSALTSFPGVEVDIFTRIQIPLLREAREITPGIRIVHLEGGPERELDRKDLYDHLPRFTESLERFILKEQKEYDIVHSHYWLSGLVGDWVTQRFGCPHIHTYHTLGFMKNKVFSQDEHPMREKSEKHLALLADGIISCSGEEKDELLKEYKIPSSRVKVVYPGVNTELFRPLQNDEVLAALKDGLDQHTVLYTGRIDPIKGLMTVIEAFEVIKEKNARLYDSLRLVVIGGGEEKKELLLNREALRVLHAVRQKKLADKILFLGSKKHNELRAYYSAADVLVVPSLYESFGLVTIEALACGTPVVVSQVGKMRSIVKEGRNGFSFRPNDPYSLSQSLEHFFENKHKLWAGQRIRQDIMKRFSWEKTASAIYEMYADFISRKEYSTTKFQPGGNLPPV